MLTNTEPEYTDQLWEHFVGKKKKTNKDQRLVRKFFLADSNDDDDDPKHRNPGSDASFAR